MPDYPSQVHNKVTNHLRNDFESYGSYRRQSHLDEFDAASSVYSFLDDPEKRSKADLLSSCRQNAWFTRHVETGEIRIASNACHLRWCPVCADSRKNFIGHSVAEWLAVQQYPKLMTLTLKHRDVPLFRQIDDLYRYFVLLRKLKDFRDIVTGGVWFFQIKQSGISGEWHPHIHCVVTGKYMPRRLLRRLWIETTGDSMIIDIRSVKDPGGCALEVARYAAKPGPLNGLSLEHAVELVSVMHSRRICGTWGTGRKISLRPPKFKDKDKWSNVGSWTMVMSNRKSDVTCHQIFHAWKSNEPLIKGITCYNHEAKLEGRHVCDMTDSTVLEEIYSESWVPP